MKNKIFDENDNSNFSKAKQNIYEERITKYNEVISKWEQYNKGNEITLKFGIRPEDIITGDDLIKFKDLSDEYIGTVTIAEFLGHEYFIHFDFEGNYITAKIPVTKNLLKFHLILLPWLTGHSFFKKVNNGSAFSPFTSTFLNCGKATLNFITQKL